MLQANLVSKTACLRELKGIFDSSLVSMLVSIGENFNEVNATLIVGLFYIVTLSSVKTATAGNLSCKLEKIP